MGRVGPVHCGMASRHTSQNRRAVNRPRGYLQAVMQGFAAVLPSALGSIYAANEGPCHDAKFTVWVQMRVPFWKQAVVPGIQLDDMIRQNAQAEPFPANPNRRRKARGTKCGQCVERAALVLATQ